MPEICVVEFVTAASTVTEVMLAVKVLSAQVLGDIDGVSAVLSTEDAPD
jgi:hypothetical protein